jgi:sRNA-binding protein
MADDDPTADNLSDLPPTPLARKAEQKRGSRTSREYVPALRERWPAAFPADDRKVRPLVNVIGPIAEAMGWTVSFTHGVLKGWKSSAAYCRAILRDVVRFNLDGSPSDQPVDDKARQMAAKRLAEIKARREREAAKKAAAAAAVPSQAAAPHEPPPPSPEPEPPPAPFRSYLRKGKRMSRTGQAAGEALPGFAPHLNDLCPWPVLAR